MSRILAILPVNVILTLDASPSQTFYDVDVPVVLTELNAEEQKTMETDIVEFILSKAPSKVRPEELVKISLQYSPGPDEVGPDHPNVAFLLRNNAKYWFLPENREDPEHRILDRLGMSVAA